MSHHYGEYWSEWSDATTRQRKISQTPTELFDEIRTYLLTIEESERTSDLIKKIEEQIVRTTQHRTDF